jgi:hypothetical protein
MDKVRASFENSIVYVGLDVYKRSWNSGIFLIDRYVPLIKKKTRIKQMCVMQEH